MHSHRALYTLVLLLVAPCLIAAACTGDEPALTETELLYDAFVGSWSATSFVVAEGEEPGPATDLTAAPPAHGRPLRVTLRFAQDRTGRLEFSREADGTQVAEQGDDFWVAEVGEHSLTLQVDGHNPDETVLVEYFRSQRDDSLTLRFSYDLDPYGQGEHRKCRIIAIFERNG
jgi:hypothetical protein